MKYKILIVALAIWCNFSLLPSLFAATVESVTAQIDDINSQIQALDREIKQYQDQISTTSAQS
ncbi:MAG: hypothetical protein AAB895_00800, partial [Patescibacteria group bacterium]